MRDTETQLRASADYHQKLLAKKKGLTRLTFPKADSGEGPFGVGCGDGLQDSASMPLRRITFSNFRDGPLGRFSPISHF
jgi:hypothetical protein